MDLELASVPGFTAVRRQRLDAEAWLDQLTQARAAGARLGALWASDARAIEGAYRVCVVLQEGRTLDWLELLLPAEGPLDYPDISGLFPAAGRMQRAAYDLLGVRATAGDQRPWLRHTWPQGLFPLRADAPGDTAGDVGESGGPYPFVSVAGDGVHEIPVGPVHAGIIEPGHFRFSVVGEKVLRLEERLGYTHKGIEKRFERFHASEGQRLAARVSGDSAVGFSWAYCMALEALCGTQPPPRALYLRALALERERLANHLGDLGALGNDAGFAFGLSQFGHLKECLLRTNADIYGCRYPMDEVVPGGVMHDLSSAAVARVLADLDALAAQLAQLDAIYTDHPGLQDRFVGAGKVAPELAARLGLIGLAGRASGQAFDLRCDCPAPPYDRLEVRKITRDEGDVAARVMVRFEETRVAIELCRQLLRDLPSGDIRGPLPAPRSDRPGLGLVEGWRGPLLVALEVGGDGRIARCRPQDPSWHNWPVLEHAIIDNIVPDFPLINKSFNLAYSGHDL
ncbi:MAG: NADH-quinone oxidoreductase subunit C [Porticoccaceae bacterium]